MCPYSELFWSVFPGIRTEYGEIRSEPVRMGENNVPDDSFHVWTFRLWFFKLWYWLTLININSELDVFAMILTLTTREMNYNTLLWFEDRQYMMNLNDSIYTLQFTFFLRESILLIAAQVLAFHSKMIYEK